MKKENIAILVLISCFGAGIFFWKHNYPFFGDCCCGCTATLLLFSSIGKQNARKAAARIDKIIADERASRDIMNN